MRKVKKRMFKVTLNARKEESLGAYHKHSLEVTANDETEAIF